MEASFRLGRGSGASPTPAPRNDTPFPGTTPLSEALIALTVGTEEGVEGAELHFFLPVNYTYGMVMVMTTPEEQRADEVNRAQTMLAAAVANLVYFGVPEEEIEGVFDTAMKEANADRERREALAEQIARINAFTAGEGLGYREAA